MRELLMTVAVLPVALAGCGGAASPTAPTNSTNSNVAAEVMSVSPSGNMVNVSVSTSVVVTFSRAMRGTAAMYVSLHLGTIGGPVVSGQSAWSTDSTQLTFTPDAPLAPHTTYVLHLGGGMMDQDGQVVGLDRCAQFGGEAASGQMMGGGMMGGAEMGSGWQTPGTGSYGMIFTFTTA